MFPPHCLISSFREEGPSLQSWYILWTPPNNESNNVTPLNSFYCRWHLMSQMRGLFNTPHATFLFPVWQENENLGLQLFALRVCSKLLTNMWDWSFSPFDSLPNFQPCEWVSHDPHRRLMECRWNTKGGKTSETIKIRKFLAQRHIIKNHRQSKIRRWNDDTADSGEVVQRGNIKLWRKGD